MDSVSLSWKLQSNGTVHLHVMETWAQRGQHWKGKQNIFLKTLEMRWWRYFYCFNLSTMFKKHIFIHQSLIFCCKMTLVASLTNIGQGWKGLPGTKRSSLLWKVITHGRKSFITVALVLQGSGLNSDMATIRYKKMHKNLGTFDIVTNSNFLKFLKQEGN